MDKNESKYFNTAEKMDSAFLELLGERDFEFITVKAICKKAGVNRSTFYLHYETLDDLLKETVDYVMRRFKGYFHEKHQIENNVTNLSDDEICLVNKQHLIPYLTFVMDNKKLFITGIERLNVLQMGSVYDRWFTNIFSPIFQRFNIPRDEQNYIARFYLNGITAVTQEWLKNGCSESVEQIANLLERLVNAKWKR